ncbi:hypothetical protein NP493_229g02009 [Ridgeia piscesae]|uniref:G-protein coupled receptors family 1 profile domain-containing protein n=1 Tax=Ridgeia piscesae TaxID=27915 RepID=A0AAD9P035_RIDPI|nr:hypothetical protein NP493_229g02009 [Ridgeia piscesae]
MAAMSVETRDRLLSRILTSFLLTTVLLLVGGLANVHLVWLTTRRRFPTRWETFRQIVRYASIVDLSLCAVLASVVLWPYVTILAGSDVAVTPTCTWYDRECLRFSGAMVVGCGIVAAARQTVTLLTFPEEEALLCRNRMRTARLMRDVTVVGVVVFVGSELCEHIVPEFRFSVCYVVGPMTCRAAFLLLVPVVASVAIGGVVLARAVAEQPRADQSSHAAKLAAELLPPEGDERAPEEVSDTRWNRVVVVIHVAVVTWFTMALAMAAAGVLTEPVTATMLYLLSSCTSLTSAWSLYAVLRYWS